MSKQGKVRYQARGLCSGQLDLDLDGTDYISELFCQGMEIGTISHWLQLPFGQGAPWDISSLSLPSLLGPGWLRVCHRPLGGGGKEARAGSKAAVQLSEGLLGSDMCWQVAIATAAVKRWARV